MVFLNRKFNIAAWGSLAGTPNGSQACHPNSRLDLQTTDKVAGARNGESWSESEGRKNLLANPPIAHISLEGRPVQPCELVERLSPCRTPGESGKDPDASRGGECNTASQVEILFCRLRGASHCSGAESRCISNSPLSLQSASSQQRSSTPQWS